MYSVWLVLSLGMLLLLPVDCAVDADADEELDPFDMVNFDHISMKMKKKQEKTSTKPSEEENILKEDDMSELKLQERREEKETASESTQKSEAKVQEDEKVFEKDVPGEKILESKLQKKEKGKVPPVRDKSRPQQSAAVCAALPRFQQFVSRLLTFVKPKVSQEDDKTPTELCLHIALTPQHLEVLENFKQDSSNDRMIVAHDILTQAIKGAHVLDDDDPILRMMWIEKQFGVTVEKALKIVLILVLFVVLLLFMSKLRFSRRLFVWMVFLAFLASVVQTWYRLYKGEVAKTQSAMMKDLPSGCSKLKDEGGTLENILNFWRHYFTFQQDACEEFYEHLYIDPIVKVSPMEALAVAVVQTALKPMRTVGTEISQFMRALLKDLPVQWQWLSVVVVVVFIILALFLSCGYGIRVPFLLAIEPSHHRGNPDDMRALKQEIQDLHAKIEARGTSGSETHGPVAPLHPSQSAPAVQHISSSDVIPAQSSGVMELEAPQPSSPSDRPASLTTGQSTDAPEDSARKQPTSAEDRPRTDRPLPSPDLVQPVQEVGPVEHNCIAQKAS